MQVTFKNAQIFHSAGIAGYQTAYVFPAVDIGYQLGFGRGGVDGEIENNLSSQRKEIRIFKTIDAATKEARKIGYTTVIVTGLN